MCRQSLVASDGFRSPSLASVFTQVFALGARGVFHDEIGASLAAFTYGASDGFSVEMDANHTTVTAAGMERRPPALAAGMARRPLALALSL